MNLNESKAFLIKQGYTISRRFKTKSSNKYWLYELEFEGVKKSLKSRDVEILAKQVKMGKHGF